MVGLTLSRMLMGFVDFVVVSKLNSVDALAAISPCTLLLFAVACVGMGIAQSAQTFIAQAVGRGEPHRAGRYVWQNFILAAIATTASVPIALNVHIWIPWLGHRGKMDEHVIQLGVEFMTYALWSIGPITATAGIESFWNGVSKPRVAFVGVLAALATITVCNVVFVFGYFGFPAMGIAGSGLATLVGWLVRLVVVATPLFWRSIDDVYHTRRAAGFDLHTFWDMLRVGCPIAFQWLVDIGAWVVFQWIMLPPYGPVAQAAANIAFQYMHLSFMPALGIGMALTTQVGNAIGAGAADVAIQRVYVARRLIVGYMGLIGVLFLLAGKPLAGFFTNDALVIQHCFYMLLWTALFQLSDAICVTYSFAARGAGDTKVPALLFAIVCWGVFVLGGIVIRRALPQLGYNGPWMMCTAYIIILGVLLWWRFHTEKWRDIKLFAEPAKPA
ncbi:MAG: MATE family efflux transporter [Phycisphaerales bacterium]|nr:MATE family efflux transporter [Phycisphaerales bacterium]